MRPVHSNKLQRFSAFLAGVLVVKVTVSVVVGYRDYFPANFASDFLSGRQAYFFGGYQAAFYAHVMSGPVTLLLGLILVSDRFRRRWPKWHRTLGKAQIALVLCLLAPSGLWMAPYAEGGAVAASGFAALALATGACAFCGWRTAVKRRFDVHRRWMWRCFLLLSSAVVLRLIGGLATVTGLGAEWSYPLAAWVSWLGPLAAYELSRVVQQPVGRTTVAGERQAATSTA